jgi:hypothetical protein
MADIQNVDDELPNLQNVRCMLKVQTPEYYLIILDIANGTEHY